MEKIKWYRKLLPIVREAPSKIKWQPTPVFLPRKFHGQRSLVDCSPWGHKETRVSAWAHTDTHAHTHTHTQVRAARACCFGNSLQDITNGGRGKTLEGKHLNWDWKDQQALSEYGRWCWEGLLHEKRRECFLSWNPSLWKILAA